MPATYEPIATTTLASTANSITFSSIPNTYTDLRLSIVHSGTWTSLVYGSHYLRFNSDSGSNYSYTALRSSPSGIATDRDLNLTEAFIGYSIAAPANNSYFSGTTIDIFSYAGSTNKTFISTHFSDTRDAYSTQAQTINLWRNTSAISTILIYPGDAPYRVGTTATLYGIKAA